MPSGFQQDQNQLTPGFYRVVLTLNGGTATYPSVANSNSTTVSGGVYVQDWSYFTTLPTTQNYSNCLSQGNPRWQAIIEELEKRFDSKVARSMLIRLPAGEKILPHPDSGHYLMSVHRCHIPVQTNPDVLFTVGSTTINMKVGQGYEINNSKWHRVENNGTTDRMHLLVDLMPNNYKYLEERGKIHPETFRPPPK